MIYCEAFAMFSAIEKHSGIIFSDELKQKCIKDVCNENYTTCDGFNIEDVIDFCKDALEVILSHDQALYVLKYMDKYYDSNRIPLVTMADGIRMVLKLTEDEIKNFVIRRA